MASVEQPRRSRRGWELAWVGAFVLAGVGVALAYNPVPTTVNDFFEPGTQPNTLSDPIVSAQQCAFCHSDYNEEQAPYNRWSHSIMAQAARDPIFKAALAIAEQDAVNSGNACIRCHAPAGFLAGHAVPTDGSALTAEDQQGISCSICHRMVNPDPAATPEPDPADDVAILAALNPPALQNPHNGSYVIDPHDNRRGPFNLDADWQNEPTMGWPGYHEYRQSPFHLTSLLCATCHDVSLPHFSRQPDGTYALNTLDTPGPTDKYQQYPEQRTFSEWSKSLFGQGAVDLAGRFGGLNGPAVSTCQDCHMPGISGQGCALEPPVRPNPLDPSSLPLPQHNFSGANSWVIRAIRSIYFDSETGMTETGVDEAIARNVAMLQAASDLEVSKVASNVNVRITNFSGHKLPTGYSEGRRMWIDVQFKDGDGNVILEHGAYDALTATLDDSTTKVYQRVSGISAATAAFTGQSAGPSTHLVLNSVIVSDNRIPPMGYNVAQFTSVQAEAVPNTLYADGQYWDDTQYAIPQGAQSVTVNVYHQTTSREYIEFLRDANTTNNAGQLAYQLWSDFGQSEPVLMDTQTLPLTCPCDWNNSGTLSVQDIFDYLTSYFSGAGDFNNSGSTTVQDIFDFLTCYFSGC